MSHALGDYSKEARPIFLEVCAGSAVLSFYVGLLSSDGVQTVAVDHEANKHSPKVPIVKLDLTAPNQVQIVEDLIKSGSVGAAHFAVPCGTCSRAREIPLAGGNGPKPLRSETMPFGLPGLSEVDQARVDCANKIYQAVFDLIDILKTTKAVIVIENPDRSIFWHFPKAISLLNEGFSDVRFQHCKWTLDRAMRPKWVRLRSNVEALSVLEGPCSANHKHLGWGISETGTFNTASEAEYPPEMASTIAGIVNTEMFLRGYVNAYPCVEKKVKISKRIRAATNKQPRGKAIPPVLSEFGKIVQCKRSEVPAGIGKVLRTAVPLHLLQEGGVHVDAAGSKASSTDGPENVESNNPDDEVVAGIFRIPEEFAIEALKVPHPVDSFLDAVLPEEIVEAIAYTFRVGPSGLAQQKVGAIKALVKLIDDEKEADAKIFEGMDPLMSGVLEGKKLHTMNLLRAKWAFNDENVVDDMIRGFSITGMQPFHNAFRHEVRLPETSEAALRNNSLLNNKLNLIRTVSSGDSELDAKFYQQALAERDRGWLVGPFSSMEQYEQTLGHTPHVSRRFPLDQSDKIRSIDDLLESGVNTTFGCQDKLVLHDVDFVAAMIRTIQSVLSGNESVCDSTGTPRVVSTHSAWNSGNTPIREWAGKTIDLSEAYKQCAVHPDSRWAAAIAVFDPVAGEPKIFGQATLPFGAASAVLSFNRVSRLLYYLGCKELFLIWSSFFDDYSTLAPKSVGVVTSTAAILMLKLLGWRVSDKPGKDRPWSELFTTLGVVFDISRISESLATVGNKEDRKAKLLELLHQVIATKFASAKECESLRGKLVYADTQVFGRASKGKLKVFERKSGKGKNFSDNDVAQIRWLVNWLQVSPPRLITPTFRGQPLVLFTDGACEPSDSGSLTTCGAVLLDPRTKSALTFGVTVSKELTSTWEKETGKKQLVTEAELLPQLLARRLWKDRLSGAKLLSFIDSEPAKFALIRGTSDVSTCADIAAAVSLFDAQQSVWTWYSRVPSASNIADAPSRLQVLERFSDYEVLHFCPDQPASLKGGVWRELAT